MRQRQLTRYLSQWQRAGLIEEAHVQKIAEYMKVERHRQWLRLIRILFIVGACWLVFGFLATLRLLNLDILRAIGRWLHQLMQPLIQLARYLSPKHYGELLSGIGCLIGWAPCHWLGLRLRRRSEMTMVRLGFLQEKELRLGTSTFTVGYLLAAAGWQLFNAMIEPGSVALHGSPSVALPVFSLLGTAFFLTVAYVLHDQIALLFGIGFLAQAVGMFTFYACAMYVLGVEMPVIQLLISVLLVFVGLWHVERVRGREDQYQFIFGRTYQWTGLLLGYLALWIMSLWGITIKAEPWAEAGAGELWLANILFIAAALGVLAYGAAQEDRMFFNFGLTFFLIETYTVFFSRIWSTMGAAFGSLVLGVLLIGTGYALRHLWLQGRLFKKAT